MKNIFLTFLCLNFEGSRGSRDTSCILMILVLALLSNVEYLT